MGVASGVACCNTPSPLTPLLLAQVWVATCTLRPLAEQVAAPAAMVAAEQQPTEKKSKKKKQRVRDPNRTHGKKELLQQMRLTLPPPRMNEGREVKDVQSTCELQAQLQVVAPTFSVKELPEIVAALDGLLLAVDKEPSRAWLVDDRKMLAPDGDRDRLQLPIPVRGGPGRVQAGTQQLALGVSHKLAAIGPPCPRCGGALINHGLSEVSVNKYAKGVGFCIHVDGEKGCAMSVALPSEWQGGFFRVCLGEGENAMQFRDDPASINDVVPKRAQGMHYVPMQCYSGVLFDGVKHLHEISEVTLGARYSLVIGFKKCKPCMSL